ncbi:corrinoid protein [Sporomusa acidovorans]|uniref:Glutamate mutase sigma subunit n=1 Tax=Sporomusa acidovorans (strain ATCC 49682 / DSM 3132 / Mol) TaxID=1123286 RepID=A0ABZ3J798_SPOA4|nr:corrinoid protein [Sporomusa acidovorans]OZC21219.1 methionine synthase [Sporomusa acidovorans DSM 3132]SDE65137.1 methyltransferase cognate corrinoid proteins [Sporomusa acidovorans]
MSVQNIFDAVLDFDEDLAVEGVKKEIAAGTDVSQILNQGLIGAMDEVGKRFSAGDLFVPEMLMAAQAMKAGLDVLKPHLAKGDTVTRGAVVIGTVKGDLHDIGKNLVAMMLEGAGFEVFDIGMDVDVEKFLATAQEKNAGIIAMSALLTTTMPGMEEVVKTIRAKELNIKTLVGGAPVTPEFARKIGADAYCEDAPAAVEAARKYS